MLNRRLALCVVEALGPWQPFAAGERGAVVLERARVHR